MEKILNVSQGIHLRFFPISKIEYQLNLHFLATGRFCRPSLELFTTRLGFTLIRRIPTDIWLRQPGANIDIQFCETDAPIAEGDKHNSHISFLSETPEAELREIASWFESRGRKTRIGSWSAKEFYLDVPEVFVDFAIESMLPELADYDL